MKKTITLAIMIAALAAGCTKNEFQGAPVSTESLVFTATIEPTKAVLDGVQVKWEDGDEITISDGTNSVVYVASASDGTTCTFTKKDGQSAELLAGATYTAYYPSSIASGTLPSAQEAANKAPLEANETNNNTPSLFKANPMVATSTSTVLPFKNICGLVHFVINGYDAVTSAKVGEDVALSYISLSADQALSGQYSIEGGKAVVSAATGDLRLNNANAKWLSKVKDFYGAVPEGEYTGMKINLVSNVNGVQTFSMKSGSKLSIQRNKITTITLSAEDLVYVDLDSDLYKESANCYVLNNTPVARYRFKAVKGNSATPVGTVDHAGMVWMSQCNTATLDEGTNALKDFTYNSSDNTISFLYPVRKNMNYLVAAYDADNNILWSWHIWARSAVLPADVTLASGATIMSLNLGSWGANSVGSANSIGLFYQWGRKDPFVGNATINSATSATVRPEGTFVPQTSTDAQYHTDAWATQHPTCFLVQDATSHDWLKESDDNRWGTTKTINDPCPPGYRVASADAFTGDGAAFTWDSAKYGSTFKDNTLTAGTWLQTAGFILHGTGVPGSIKTRSYYQLCGSSVSGATMQSDCIDVASSSRVTKTYRAVGGLVRCQLIPAK